MWRTYKSYKLNFSIYVVDSKEDSTTTVLELQTGETPTIAPPPPSYQEAIGLHDNYNAPLLGPVIAQPRAGYTDASYGDAFIGTDSNCCDNCTSCFECFIDICTCICCCFAGC